jgi:mannose-6-phosphate isomerase-like protein (cupin superfamily)
MCNGNNNQMRRSCCNENGGQIRDYGPYPIVVNIDKLANINPNYRSTLWTGEYLQVTLMSIPVGGDIGLEMHPETDQFIRIESGCALVQMGNSQNNLSYKAKADNRYAAIVPAGTWHNITNIGNTPLKVYSIYAPPHHPFGTVQATKAIADAEEAAAAAASAGMGRGCCTNGF